MPNVLSPRDLVFRPDNMDETVPHTTTDCRVSCPLASENRDIMEKMVLPLFLSYF